MQLNGDCNIYNEICAKKESAKRKRPTEKKKANDSGEVVLYGLVFVSLEIQVSQMSIWGFSFATTVKYLICEVHMQLLKGLLFMIALEHGHGLWCVRACVRVCVFVPELSELFGEPGLVFWVFHGGNLLSQQVLSQTGGFKIPVKMTDKTRIICTR